MFSSIFARFTFDSCLLWLPRGVWYHKKQWRSTFIRASFCPTSIRNDEAKRPILSQRIDGGANPSFRFWKLGFKNLFSLHNYQGKKSKGRRDVWPCFSYPTIRIHIEFECPVPSCTYTHIHLNAHEFERIGDWIIFDIEALVPSLNSFQKTEYRRLLSSLSVRCFVHIPSVWKKRNRAKSEADEITHGWRQKKNRQECPWFHFIPISCEQLATESKA